MLLDETELERPPVASQYNILSRIGQGAFGEVCLIKLCTDLADTATQQSYSRHVHVGSKGSAPAFRPSTSPETGLQQKASPWPVS